MSKIHLADPPPYCSSCFEAKPEAAHVDFGAYWDGPVIEGATRVAIDDLVICEDCIRQAARVLPGNKEASDIVDLTTENEGLRERLRGALAYIERLEQAAEERGKLSEALRPPKPPAKTSTRKAA